MATPGESGYLSDQESADLLDRVARFRSAWNPDGSSGLRRYLPPSGSRHRSAVLIQVVVADMELRAAAGLPFRVESYIERLPQDLNPASIPIAILTAEYQLRYRLVGRPDLTEYRDRFPARFDELMRALAELQPPPTSDTHTRIAPLGAAPPPTGGAKSKTVHDSRRAPVPQPKFIGDLVATNAGNLDATPVRGGGSTVLPNDTPYQLGRLIGSGAFGEVFEALAPGGIRVAVKRILRNVDHPASVSERDALEAIKGLSHPFLLKTNAYWVFDDRLVIVMELADGSLADRVEHHMTEGRIGVPPEELIPLFEQAGDALDYLHSQNVSHRDIKPENILILKGYAKVADFGLARPQEHALTMVGNTVGTPAYMAPEMWKQQVSLQSDQYSLAATYVRARLGRPLFSTTVLIDMANFHVHETPNLDPLAAPEQAVLLKALAKNPDDRYPTCLGFARALRAAVLTASESDLSWRTGGSASRAALPAMQDPSRRTGGSGLRDALPPEQDPPRRRDVEGVLRIAAIAIACALAVGLVNWMTKPSPQIQQPQDKEKVAEKEKEKVVEKEKDKDNVAPVRFAVYPANWRPVEGTGTYVIGDKHYHHKLTRNVAGEDLVAILVHPTGPNDQDELFYMLQNKVTNRVFAHTWDVVLKSQALTVSRLKKDFPDYVPGDWRDGAEHTENGTRLGIVGRQAGVPVLSVTLPEAMLVAGELGGRLPTTLQWKRATGALSANTKRPGPAGAALIVPDDLKGPKKRDEANEFLRKSLRERKLALGLLDGPTPVTELTTDVSEPWGIHQLVSNGQEWIGEDLSQQQFNLANIPDAFREAVVVGQGPNELTVTTFEAILKPPGMQSWGNTKSATGFRVVLKPQ